METEIMEYTTPDRIMGKYPFEDRLQKYSTIDPNLINDG